MILEQLAQDVSNRPFFGADCPDDSIREAVLFASRTGLKQNAFSVNLEKKAQHSKKPSKGLVSEILKKGKSQETAPEKNRINNSREEIDQLKELYGLLEEQNIRQIDYGKLFSYLERRTNLSSEYQLEQETSKQKSSLMSDTEAREIVQKIQLSYLTGNKGDIPYEDKERFHQWQKFNVALLMLYHRLSLVPTDEIDYNKMN